MIAIDYLDSGREHAAPILKVVFLHPDETWSTDEMECRIDTGADRTVLPAHIASLLSIDEVDKLEFAGYDGHVSELTIGIVHVRIGTLDSYPVAIAFGEFVEDFLLGRDVLNQYRILLDGPNRRLEIQ